MARESQAGVLRHSAKLAVLAATLGVCWTTFGVAAPTELNPGLGPAPAEVRRDSPREMVAGYLEAYRLGRFDLAAHYLDLSQLPPVQQRLRGARLARRVGILVMQKAMLVPEALSDDPSGTAEDDLTPDQERVAILAADGSHVEVVLRRHELGGGKHAWTFDAATVAALDRLYVLSGNGWLGERLPELFFSVRLLSIQLWQWCALVLLLLVGWGAARLLGPRLLAAMKRAADRTETEWDDALVEVIGGPLRLGVLLLFLLVTVPFLDLSPAASEHLAPLWRLAVLVIVGWLASRWISVGARMMERSAIADRNHIARTFLPIFVRILKVGVWALVGVVGLDALGFRVMGLVAGLGIGGLAFAFAAQKTIENLFGSVALAADRPFEVGHFIDAGGVQGVVEDVGLRSTRLRTPRGTQVTIPNGVLMAETIENLTDRKRTLFELKLPLRCDSTVAQVEYVLDEVKKLFRSHPQVLAKDMKARLDRFDDSAITVTAQCWVATTEMGLFAAVKEELLFAVLRILESSGTGLALPSQSLLLGRDAGIDRARADQVAAIVSERRSRGELWIPEPPAAVAGETDEPDQPEQA